MTAQLWFGLSFAMFLEFAIWGAWAPVLAARLLGPLKMNGKQTGWIYATLPLACIVFPLLAGTAADNYLNTEWILGVAHLAGAVLLFLASKQTKFKSLFGVMLLYSICYASTLPLVNSLMFAQLGKAFSGDSARVGAASVKIFLWAPVAWALIGYSLTGWRWKFKTGEEGRDCLIFAAILSAIMAVGCFTILPATPPAAKAAQADAAEAGAMIGVDAEDTAAVVDAVESAAQEAGIEKQSPLSRSLKMLGDTNFLIFILVSIVAGGLMQFYFLGTAPFMQEIGIPAKNVPASMAIAQAVQAAATWFLLSRLMGGAGPKWTLVIGAACWASLYGVYVLGQPRGLIVVSQALHGLAYVFFIIAGQIYVSNVADPEILSTAQGLIFAATTGVGLFLGTQFAGIIMDKFSTDGKFQWKRIFAVPGIITAVCVLVLILLFRA